MPRLEGLAPRPWCPTAWEGRGKCAQSRVRQAHALGGTLDVTSAPGETAVRLTVPLQMAEGQATV